MYFDKIIQALNDFDTVETAAAEAWKATQKKLSEDYGNTGRVYVDEYAKGKALYDATVAEAKQKGKAVVTEEIQKIHGIVQNFVTTPVPSDFMATLEAIRATGKALSKGEAEVYLEKYKGNYTAYMSLANLINECTGEKVYFVKYDAIKNDIDEYGGMALKTFDQYGMGGYMRALMISEQHTPLLAIDKALQKFMREDVGSYVDPQKAADEEKLAADLAALNQNAIEKERMKGR